MQPCTARKVGAPALRSASRLSSAASVLPSIKIKLGQNDAVGDGNLLSRNGFPFERGAAVHGIDRRHHAAERETGRDGRIRHQRVEDRRRVGKSACFDHDPIEPRARALVTPAQQVLQRLRQIGARPCSTGSRW